MRLLLNAVLLVIALGTTLAAGILHGRFSHRWGGHPAAQLAAQRLMNVPEEFGAWRLEESLPLSQFVIDTLQCAGYLNHRYLNQDTGEEVNVAVLVGPPGPISVHTPEICYSSREFHVGGQRRVLSVSQAGAGQEFWAVDMQPRRLEGSPLRVCYAWTTDGRWAAVEEPRLSFAGKPLLFKMQLSAPLLMPAEGEPRDTCLEFLTDFLPAITQPVFGSDG